MKRKRKSKGPYAAVPIAIMNTAAWRTMSPEGRLLWIELRSRLRNDGLNNGTIFRSCRDAAKALGFSKNTVARRYSENEHYGFLRKTGEGFLGSDGRGIAARYRFTDLAHGTHPPTRDYEKWDRTPFVYTPRRPGRKKQKPVPPCGTPRTTAWDIRKAGNGGAVCPTAWDIGAAPRGPTARDISSLPYPAPRGAMDQGSSTARAPACAGGAGSSPAPDAKPDLTAMLLSDPRQPDAVADVPHQVETQPPAPRDQRHSHEGLMTYVAGVIEEQLCELDAKWAAAKAANPATVDPVVGANQQDNSMSYRKPWDAEGISRATWYRRHRETIGETETAGETVSETGETETAGETAPPARNNLVMAALEVHYTGHAPERRQQAIEDAQKYQATWGQGPHGADWTATQEASLIWQLCGREVKQLTSAQAVVGNKIIYRTQLGA